MGENKNLFIAIALSLLVMIGYDQMFLQPQMEEAQRRAEAQAALNAEGDGIAPTATPDEFAPAEEMAPADSGTSVAPANLPQYVDAGTVTISTPELMGSLSLGGARFDDLSLVNHMTSIEDDAENIQLLKPADAADGYYVRFGWTARGKDASFVPGENTVWTADKDAISAGETVTLSWDNGQNVTFQLAVSVDDRFMFSVDQSVINNSGEEIQVAPYGMINRRGLPDTSDMYILHEGPIGVLNGELVEKSYDDLEEDGAFETSSTGGWLGITDKFWMTTLVPDQNESLSRARMIRRTGSAGLSHRVDYVQDWTAVANGSATTTEANFYAGAKIVSAIDDYAEQYNIALYDRTIDWGWFYFLTRPIFYLLHMLFEMTGNFGVAILLLTVLIKLVLYPLANKSYVSMSHMKQAQPKMKALQERYKDDRQKLQQEMMALYQKEKINPMSGCLPMLLQIPVFFALYKVLFVTIEMRHQPFFGWIQDLSAPDPLTPVNLFGLIPWDPPSIIAIGIWPILMGVTMWAQQKLNPQTSMDPTQQKIMAFLPIIFTFILANFSAGLVIYWTWNSVLSALQQWYIMRREEARQG